MLNCKSFVIGPLVSPSSFVAGPWVRPSSSVAGRPILVAVTGPSYPGCSAPLELGQTVAFTATSCRPHSRARLTKPIRR